MLLADNTIHQRGWDQREKKALGSARGELIQEGTLNLCLKRQLEISKGRKTVQGLPGRGKITNKDTEA